MTVFVVICPVLLLSDDATLAKAKLGGDPLLVGQNFTSLFLGGRFTMRCNSEK